MNSNPLTKLQSAVYHAIKEHTKLNPIASPEIAEIVRLETVDGKAGSNLRSVINILRDKGYAICANQDGYYYAQTAEQLREYIEEFQERIDQQQQACNALINKYNILASLESSGIDVNAQSPATMQMQFVGA